MTIGNEPPACMKPGAVVRPGGQARGRAPAPIRGLRRRAPRFALLAVTACVIAAPAGAQSYPNRPIRMIVPFASGGGTDTVARVVARRVSDSLGQSIVVDNRGGGGGTIAAEMAVRANPDGYTLIMISGSYGTNAALYKLPYDPVADIQPITLIGETGFLIAAHPSVPIANVTELITYAKSNPGRLNYGSAGTGGMSHLAGELFRLEAKVNLTHVPYKGAGPALNDLIGGQIQLTFNSILPLVQHVRTGRLRGIGVSTARRSDALPGVQAVGESVAGYEVVLWYGIAGPRGLSKDIVARWNKEVANVLRHDEVKSQMAGQGLDLAGSSPQQFLDVIRRDVEKWKKVVKEIKLTVAS